MAQPNHPVGMADPAAAADRNDVSWAMLHGIDAPGRTDLYTDPAPLAPLHIGGREAAERSTELAGLLLPPATMLALVPLARLPVPIDTVPVTSAAQSGKTPLFLIHDGSGTTSIYRWLVRRMGSDRPLLGIEAGRGAGGRYEHTSIMGMARAYIVRMRTIQPQGPYLLAGLGAGGVIAFDMACQLQAMGQKTAFVGIIDGADVEAHQRTSRIFRPGSGFFTLRRSPDPTFLRLWKQARQAHRPQGVFREGEVVLFKTTQGAGPREDRPASTRYTDCLLGWGKRVAGEVTLVAIPGGHRSALQEPHVDVLARSLCEAIARALPEEAL